MPVPYCHVVFTPPRDTLAQLALANPRVVYGILLRAAAGIPSPEMAADPETTREPGLAFLGGRPYKISWNAKRFLEHQS